MVLKIALKIISLTLKENKIGYLSISFWRGAGSTKLHNCMKTIARLSNVLPKPSSPYDWTSMREHLSPMRSCASALGFHHSKDFQILHWINMKSYAVYWNNNWLFCIFSVVIPANFVCYYLLGLFWLKILFVQSNVKVWEPWTFRTN